MIVQPRILCARAVFAAGLALASISAMAQPAPQGTPIRLRGTVQSLDGQTLTVLTSADEAIPVTLPPNLNVTALERRSLSDIKDGDFIGVTAGTDKKGMMHATEVHIFPEAMRGAGEGHYPWDFPDTTMTNATVTGVMAGSDGRTVKLTYKDGQAEVAIGPDTPIVTFVPGDTSLLKPGAAVFVMGNRQEDGTVNAFAVTAEKDGVKPPM